MKRLALSSKLIEKKLPGRAVPVVVFFFTLFLFLLPQNAYAILSACSASVDPSAGNVNTTMDFSVQVQNDDPDGNRLVWMKVTRPSADYVIGNYSPNGLSVSLSDSEFATWGFDLGQGSAFGQNINVSVNNNSAFSGYWTVQASDDPDGVDPTTCTGSLTATIFDPVNSVPPAISDITISNISDTSVTISWTTDKAATSVVDYGTTSDYGQNKTDSTLSTAHSVTVDSLTANTNYHYRIISVDDHDNTTSTADNTFSSAVAGTTTSETITVTSVVTVNKTTTNTTTKILIDDTAPTVRIDTDFKKPFTDAPKIIGKAYDNKGIFSIEYSLDGGKNWSPVDSTGKISTQVSFDFTPPPLDDDTYKVRMRVKDTSGNIGMSREYSMVIDRLPPAVGALMLSYGPQVLSSKNGVMYGLEGLDQKVTLSAVGGPSTIDILSNKQMFSLIKNPDNGLWSGILSFSKPGTYSLQAKSVDGAGNKTARKLGSITILPAGKITDGRSVLKGAKLSVYVKDYLTKRFVLWDGEAYGQSNPTTTKENGNYRIFMPSGTYYIQVEEPTHKTLKTNIFTLNESVPFNMDFVLKKGRYIDLGFLKIPLSVFSQDTVAVNIPSLDNGSDSIAAKLIGRKLPEIELKDGEKTVITNSLSGQPTVVTLLNSWDPNAYAQLSILEHVTHEKSAKVIPVFEQETASKMMIFKKRGGYISNMLADPDGLLVAPLSVEYLPMHIFLNRKGVVEQVKYGVLSYDEIKENLID